MISIRQANNGRILYDNDSAGAAMFVQCIVGSEVVRLAEGMGMKGAMLRDMMLYMACTSGVLLFMALGQVRFEWNPLDS
jgi:tetrahydromethanopterin S-methyltransferase subunit D